MQTEMCGTPTRYGRLVRPGVGLEQGMTFEGIVAVGLLTRNDLDVLGPTFTRLWPVETAPSLTAS